MNTSYTTEQQLAWIATKHDMTQAVVFSSCSTKAVSLAASAMLCGVEEVWDIERCAELDKYSDTKIPDSVLSDLLHLDIDPQLSCRTSVTQTHTN